MQRIQRQSSLSKIARPPDEASAAIGRGLAERLLEGLLDDDDEIAAQSIGNKIFMCFCEYNASPSLAQAYFDALASNPHDVFLTWIPQWMLQAEEACTTANYSFTTQTTLSCMITAYAQVCFKLETSSLIPDTYNRLKLSSSRTCLLRAFLGLPVTTTINLWTPLMASCVLNLSSPREEKMLFLQGIWQQGRLLIIQNDDDTTSEAAVQFLVWLTEALHMFLNGIPNETRDSQNMSMELAHQWLTQISEMLRQASGVLRQNVGAALLSDLFNQILPHFFVTHQHFVMNSILDLLSQVTSVVVDTVFDRATWFRLGALVLSTPIKSDVCSLLKLLATLPYNHDDDMVQGMLHSLTCIYANDSDCKEYVNQLRMKQTESKGGNIQLGANDTQLTNIVQLFHRGEEEEQVLLKFMTASLQNVDPLEVSALDQTFALLMACSLLGVKSVDDDKELVQSYLKTLLQQFPHLGITLLPILFQSIQTASDNKDGTGLLGELEFLCDAVVKDANCAQEVFQFVGVTLISPDNSPTSVRATAIRMFPKLVAANKKLYRRIIDTLGSLVESKEPEIRLAVAVTIDDLAQEDMIRDVSDVIGWVQTYLSDENTSVVHFAVLSLHHLVVAQELDFALVMKVLDKRLCPMGDIDALLALPNVVLEALVMLLGDGECDEETDSDEDAVVSTKASQDLIGVSPQVSKAVDTLILLANADALSRTSAKGASSENAICRIRLNIFRSLSGYSLHSLGLDDEGVQSAVQEQKSESDRAVVTDAGVRYLDLKKIVASENHSPLKAPGADSDPTVSLMRKLVSLEEESLGSSVWQKRGKKTEGSSKPDRTRAPKAAFSSLPSATQIQEMYNDNPSFSTSVASLLCYSGSSVDDLFDLASDISGGLHDPVSHVFNLQGWLRAMSMIWKGIVSSNESSTLEAVASVLEGVKGWRDLLDNADVSYLALATFTLYVPDTISDQDSGSHIDFSQTVEGVCNDVYQAYESHEFESRDMADLCLGIVGARAVHSRTPAFVDKSISALEHSISEHGGQTSFGASYGLSLIAQAAAAVSEQSDSTLSTGSAKQLAWINQIVSLLVQEVHFCLTTTAPAFVTLVACLKTGKAAPDLLSSMMYVTEELQVSETNEQKARCLLLSLALSVRAVGIVSPDLLLALYKFIEQLSWGVGKGLVVPYAVSQCVSTGVLHQNEANDIIAEHERLAEAVLEEGETKRFTDVLYACVALKTYSPLKGSTLNEVEHVESIVDKKNMSMSDECKASLLLSATMAVVTFPCLANGGQIFCSGINLHPNVNKEAVAAVVSLLTDIKDTQGSGTKSINTAVQLLGLLASAKDSSSNIVPGSVFGRTAAASDGGPRKSKQKQVSLDMLPSPQDGTLLDVVMGSIKRAWEHMSQEPQSSVANLTRLLSCLEPLSLPSEFARAFIEPMLSTDIDVLKPACIELLISQVSGRRRAAFDGRDFVKLVNRLALLPPSSFQTMVGTGSGAATFVASLYTFIPKLPSDSVEAVLLSLWKICEAELRSKCSASCAVGYLSALSTLLETKQKKETSRLSPRTYSIIIQVLLETVFLTLASGSTENNNVMHSVEKAFLDCLSQLEVTVLDENQFFMLSGNLEHKAADLSRAFCIVGLVCRQYFEQEGRSSKELLKVVAWFANPCETSNVNDASLRELAFRLAIATKDESLESKKEILSLLIEALHVRVDGRGMCLELLGILASTWSNGLECNPESTSVGTFFATADRDSVLSPAMLPSVSELTLYDMPCNMGVYARFSKLQGLIANSVLRIVRTWSEQGVAQQDISLLTGILICCRTHDNAKEHDLATLMISRLSNALDEKIVS